MKENLIKATAVSYLNTKPLLYGIFSHPIQDAIDLSLDIPSLCAQKLLSGEADLGLVPVAIIPELEQAYIISNFCIGTVGEVKTVCIFSDCPIEQLESIYLDFHSRTSVELTKILLKEYWKIQPRLLSSEAGFEDKISGKTGALIIGDRAIGLAQKYAYVYDLGDIWMKHTNLPFVFAAWVSKKKLKPDFIRDFNEALASGIDHIPQLLQLLPPSLPGFSFKEYFTHYISYELDESKKKALALYLSKLGQNQKAKRESSFIFT